MMTSENIILISDAKIKCIPIIENGDPFVDLKNYPNLKCDLSRDKIQKLADNPFRVRKSVAEKLIQAQFLLPKSLKFEIKECFRPLWVQNKFFRSYSRYLKQKHPHFTSLEIHQEASKYVAPVNVAPHSTGGAVDLVLIEVGAGREVDMGTEFNASPSKTNNKTYTHANDVSAEVKSNRAILKKVMEEVGFANYPTEWWHWSYGDQYWAFMTDHPHALFEKQSLKFKIRKSLPIDVDDIARIHTDSWKSTYQGIIEQDFLDQLNFEDRLASAERRVVNPQLNCLVAIETELNKVIGFADFGKCREKNSDADVELYAIYLYEEFQNFGAGKLLFDQGFSRLKEMNYKKMMVSVLEKNEASRIFYEKMGGRTAKGDHVDIEGIRYPTATYVWDIQ